MSLGHQGKASDDSYGYHGRVWQEQDKRYRHQFPAVFDRKSEEQYGVVDRIAAGNIQMAHHRLVTDEGVGCMKAGCMPTGGVPCTLVGHMTTRKGVDCKAVCDTMVQNMAPVRMMPHREADYRGADCAMKRSKRAGR